ncbi:DUF4301 family protein [Fulvivirga maritima]|uniref:DUF4301 family protein n=1 Tax=Fulvivirga maritima TaxID=2904247 RepID=UPI001F209E50|nr:DUF4301 family protein [Fulvivirga maritima]UII25657.1 DUF4301 family protein [Fulvivirga maritima]
MITEELKHDVEKQGIPFDKVEEQIENFKNGFPYLDIQASATIEDGILQLTDSKLSHYLGQYEQDASSKKIVKFVPASGAASRMFKSLFAFLESDDDDIENDDFVKKFITELSSFAFYDELDNTLKKNGSSIEKALERKDYKSIVHALLDPEEGMGYGELPKGLLKFHKYDDEVRTPVQEHFVEGAEYAVGKDNTVYLHFTVSPEHQERFEQHVNEIKKGFEAKYGVSFVISFSQQKRSTDTIAVNMDNSPFIEEDGSILFRPAGHGALLENLNDIDADLIFIKNIDNVVPDRIKKSTTGYKKAIAGVLLDVQSKVFEALEKLDAGVNEDLLESLGQLFEGQLNIKRPDGFTEFSLQEKVSYYRNKLDRPIRVCGMVENTGEPGGGPFWVKDEDGSLALQIGETAQLNLDEPKYEKIFKESSHFNPTDLVCGVRNYKGEKFDLLKYRDPKTGFITKKSKNGKELKAQELPGLWNGSMADWNTILVEVPLITFNPVKTINDLLREQHQ